MSRQSIRIEHPAERVTRIMLARPEKRNAQDPPLLYEFDQALADAAADRDTRVIIVGADGPDFSSGHDLSCPFTMPCNPVATLEGAFGAPGIEGHFAFECEAFLGLCRRWRELPKPTIAQVQGRVIAGGLMLVWPMDLVVAAEDASFSDPVTAFGANGVEYFAHAFEIGARRAKELLFTGEAMTAAEARQVGMVSRLVPADQLADETLKLAKQIAMRSEFALKLAKMSVNRSEDAKGFQVALDNAFGLHSLAHAHNLKQFDSLIDPAGIDIIRRSSRHS